MSHRVVAPASLSSLTMHRLSRTAFLAAGLVALVAFAAPPFASSPDDRQRETVALPSHTVEITYAERRGDLRRATIRITPRERSSRRLGEVEELGFLSSGHTTGSSWHVLSSVRQSRDGVVEARGRVPAPELLRGFAIRTASGDHLWGSPSARGDGDDKEDPEEPGDGDDDAGDDDDGDDDGETSGCGGKQCMELINPWTCECTDPNPFPDRGGDGQRVTLGIDL